LAKSHSSLTLAQDCFYNTALSLQFSKVQTKEVFFIYLFIFLTTDEQKVEHKTIFKT